MGRSGHAEGACKQAGTEKESLKELVVRKRFHGRTTYRWICVVRRVARNQWKVRIPKVSYR